MATHPSTLAWKIPRMEEPGRLQSMGLQRVGHDQATPLFLSEHTWCVPFYCSVCVPSRKPREGGRLRAISTWSRAGQGLSLS